VKALPYFSAARADVPWLGALCSCAPEPEQGASGPHAGTKRRRFRKPAKLLRHADFQRVYKNGRRLFSTHMTVFYLRREETAAEQDQPGRGRPGYRSPGYTSPGSNNQTGPRVGLTVGRVLGGAVERNRIKRRLREAVRHNLAALAIAVDVVINPKKSALTAEFSLLKDEVARAFEVINAKEASRA
jgi:ribonuclease P protein component